MERSRRLIVLGAATAVVVAALGVAWFAGLFDRSAPPEGTIAQDSVTIAVGDSGPLAQLATAGGVALSVAVLLVAISAVVWVAKRRDRRASFPPAERGRGG